MCFTSQTAFRSFEKFKLHSALVQFSSSFLQKREVAIGDKTLLTQVGKAAETQTLFPAWVGRQTQTSKLCISSFNQLFYFLSFKSAFGGVARHKTMFSIHYQISIIAVAL